MNPACDTCKTPPIETEIQLEDLSNGATAHDDLDRKNEEEKVKAMKKIRSRVRAKLEIRFKNGDIVRDAFPSLEEELVNELEEELNKNLKDEIGRTAEITRLIYFTFT